MRGTPAKIDPVLLASLKAEWIARTRPADFATVIFETGIDLRAKQETVTL